MKIFSKTTIFNYLYRILYLIVGFIAVPISIEYLGNERYGIWQTILTMIGFVSLTNFGIGNGLRNKVTEYFTNKDQKKLKIVISSAYVSLSIISLVIFIVLIPIINNMNYGEFYNVSEVSNKEISFAFSITIVGFLINFILGLVNSISFGIHKSNLVSLSQFLSAIVSLVLTLIICRFESNLIYIALIYSISNILVNLILSYMIFRLGKQFIPSVKSFDKKECKGLYTIGIGFLVLQIASLFMNTSDNFIVTKLIGVSEVTNYSIVNKLFNLVPTLFAILLIQLWSQTAKDVVEEKYINIKKSIKKLLNVLIIISIGLVMMVLLFDFITLIWLGESLNVDKLLVISAGLYALLVCFNGIFVNIQNGLGKINYQIGSYIVAALIQVPLAYILVDKFNLGVSGVMLCKAMIMLIPAIVNSIFIYKYINKKCNKLEEVKNI